MALSDTEALEVERIVKRMLSNASAAVAAQQDGDTMSDGHRVFNFQGSGVTVADNSVLRRTDIFIPGAPSATATSTFVSTAGLEKVFPVGTRPTNWFLPTFNDTAWANSVLETHSISASYTVVPTASWITESSQNGDLGTTDGLFLARRTFTLPAGSIVSATLEINYDDNLGADPGIWINGNTFPAELARSGIPRPPATYTIPIAWLNAGTTNVLAVDIFSQAGAVALSYRITVNMASAGADTRYQLLSEKDQPSGYAGLSAGSLVASAELGSGTPTGSNFLRGDRTWSPASTNSVSVAEVDGTPSVAATTIQFPNGTLTDHGSGVVEYIAASPGTVPYINIQDQKAQNTAGGTFTSGSFQVRTLNTIVSDASALASLSSNTITLPAGTYIFRISAPAFIVDSHQARLQNTSDSTTVAMGTTMYSRGGTGQTNCSEITGRFTIAGSKNFQVQHRCQTTEATFGFGLQANFGTEVYTVAEFWKVG